MAKAKAEFFRVRLDVVGTGEFPFDMLRYDSVCPLGEEDVGKLRNCQPTTVREKCPQSAHGSEWRARRARKAA